MSDLEKETGPILTPMIYGDKVSLQPQHQVRVCAWMTKTAMVFDFLNRSTPFFKEVDRRHLLRHRRPPLTVTGVWLARYSGNVSIFTKPIDLKEIVPDDRNPRKSGPTKGYGFTLAIGCFVAQILAMRYQADKPLTLVNSGPLRGTAIEIRFPIFPAVDWPPPAFLDDGNNSLDGFADRFLVGQDTSPC